MIWSCFPPQKLTIIQVKKLAKMSVQVFVTHVPHATNGEHPWSSLLFAGHPKPLQWDFCLDHLCTSSRKTGAKLFAANSVTPSFKKKAWRMSIEVGECPFLLNHTMRMIHGVFQLEALLESFGRFSIRVSGNWDGFEPNARATTQSDPQQKTCTSETSETDRHRSSDNRMVLIE